MARHGGGDALLPSSAASPVRATALDLAIALPLLAAALVDLPRAWRAGATTWLGIAAIAQLAIALVTLAIVRPLPRRLAPTLWPIGALLLWLAVGSAWWSWNADGPPNVLGYALLASGLLTGADAGARDAVRTSRTISAAMRVVDVVGLGIVVISFATEGFRVNSWPVHPRALALVALVPLCWHLARWHAGRPSALLLAALWLGALVVSLSRMATAAALAAVLATSLLHLGARGREGGHRVAPLVALFVAVLVAVTTLAPFRDRLFGQDRTPIWRRVVSSALEAPILGQGPGSSQTGPVLRYWWTAPPSGDRQLRPRYEHWEYWAPHPHNEYLRVWHDLGLPGLVLFVLALGIWSRALLRAARRSPPADGSRTELEAAALLMLLALMLAMLTDNPLVYPFVIAPAGVLLGAGLGSASSALPRRIAARA